MPFLAIDDLSEVNCSSPNSSSTWITAAVFTLRATMYSASASIITSGCCSNAKKYGFFASTSLRPVAVQDSIG